MTSSPHLARKADNRQLAQQDLVQKHNVSKFHRHRSPEILTRHESDPEAVSTNNPTRDGQWANEVSREVGSLQTTGSTSGDIEGSLKMGVQSIQQAITKAPKEEQNGDWESI